MQKYFPKGLIQVAGVLDAHELRMLLDAGVDIAGIPLRLTVNAEDITESQAAGLSRLFPGKCCLITYLNDPDEIIQFVHDLRVDYVQLHGPVDADIMPHLLKALPHVCFIKSLIVGRYNFDTLLKTIKDFSPFVWAFITDTWNPETGAEGATGVIHDWDISRRIVLASRRPVILAGGLNPDNVADAIKTVRPHGVDVHTGVENAAGGKDPDKVTEFISQAKSSFNRISS